MTVAALAAEPGLLSARAVAWRPHLAALAGLAGGLLLLFAGDLADMARIWWGTSAFGHCLLIPPILAWLVRQRAPEVARLTPRGWLPGLAVVGAGAFAWLLGDLAGVAVARHFGLIVMLQGAVAATLGPAVARGLLFPLGYALFLVPAGEGLIQPLQTLTAEMCMALLGLVGVPAHIEGVFIWIPNGYFEVAEACSGANFVIAMLAYAVLVANVCFRSWPRRLAFLAFAMAVPILANGLRAWGTIYIAHLTTADFAVGFDHVFYGWIFFAVVIAIVMAAAWPFFDRRADGPWLAAAARRLDRAGSPRDLAFAAFGAGGIALAALGWSGLGAAGAMPMRVVLPEVAGWTRSDARATPSWRPRYLGADDLAQARYVDARGRVVDLVAAAYGSQREGREVVGYGNGAVPPNTPWAWANDEAPPAGGHAARISAPGVMRAVLRFYVVDGVATGSPSKVKLMTLRARLLGRPGAATAILISAAGPTGRRAADDFLRALGSPAATAARIVAPAANP